MVALVATRWPLGAMLFPLHLRIVIVSETCQRRQEGAGAAAAENPAAGSEMTRPPSAADAAAVRLLHIMNSYNDIATTRY